MNYTSQFHKFKDALRYALTNFENKNSKTGKLVKRGQALRHIANSLVWVAINGSERDRIAAIKELGDRLDGKVVQAITGAEGEPIVLVQRVILEQDNEDDSTLTIEHEAPKTKVLN